MSDIFVQFSGATQKTIIGVFCCKQNDIDYPNQAVITSTDPAWLAYTLSQEKNAQVIALQAAYQSIINAPISFKNAAGVTSTYAFGNTLAPSGTNAQALLMQIIGAGASAWVAGVWFDTSGIVQTMTFADLQGLAAAIESAETPDEQHLFTKVAAVHAAATAADAQSINW